MLSGEAASKGGRCNTAREQQPRAVENSAIGVAEKIGIFQEERTLLREKDLEALVNRVLRLIGLYLREIGIDGGVEHQAVVENNLGIQAGLALGVDPVKARLTRIAIIHRTEVAERGIGNELQVAAR